MTTPDSPDRAAAAGAGRRGASPPAADCSTPSSPTSSTRARSTRPRRGRVAPARRAGGLRLREGRRRHPVAGRPDPVAGLLSDEFIHSTTPPSEQEIDQRTTALINPEPVRRLPQPAQGAGRRRAGGRALQKFLLPSPTATTEIAEMQSHRGVHLRCTSARTSARACRSAGARATRSSSGSRRPRQQILRAALAKFDSALAHPGLARRRRHHHQPGAVGPRAGAARPRPFADAAAAAADVPDRFQLRHRARREPAAAAERHLVVHQRRAVVGGGRGGRVRPALHHGRRPAGPGGQPGRRRGRLRRHRPRPHHAAVSPLKYPDAGSPVPVADGIEARLIEAEAQLQANNFSGMRTTLNGLRATHRPDPNLARPATQRRGGRPCCSPNGRSGCMPPATGWETCGG